MKINPLDPVYPCRIFTGYLHGDPVYETRPGTPILLAIASRQMAALSRKHVKNSQISSAGIAAQAMGRAEALIAEFNRRQEDE